LTPASREAPADPTAFQCPPDEYTILPFWFLNGDLDPEELRSQLAELHAKGIKGVILHGRYGLEMPYLSSRYLERIRLIVEEARRIGLRTWIYDEMNWPSGTAGGQVLQSRPDLAQRYIECISFSVRGPWFTYLTGADSRYLDFERSTPLAAFAVGSDGRVIDLTPNLSFENVIPWEVPAGNWRLLYIVEKRADYYIDALNPESTAEFLRLGYEPYVGALEGLVPSATIGFYTDEPAMHYFLSGGDNPVLPWTKDMLRRFRERNGYSLRPRLPDLFFDVAPDSARVRYDFFCTLTELYTEAYYRQIHNWCRSRGLLFTGHLLYEEWLRKQIRVEGNLFRHIAEMDIPGVDHLYPIIGGPDRADEHVALKAVSSAAHHLGRERVLCESFGGIFMDATMQRMKWIADWEFLLGVNLLNPHGFHYTLEGPRKRDWPPSMFYQYPWWPYYGEFSAYIKRLGYLLTGGRHAARVAVLWPINAMFATYTPQSHNPLADRTESDFAVLTDLLLRLHYDFDYLEEDVLAGARLEGGTLRVADEAYELLILPPLTHLKLSTVEQLERFVGDGGRVLGMVFLPALAFGSEGLVDVSERIRALFGVDPSETQRGYRLCEGIEPIEREHPGGGRACFLRTCALARHLPMRLQQRMGTPGLPESPYLHLEAEGAGTRYYFAPPDSERLDVTDEVLAERRTVAAALERALERLVTADITIDNPEILCLHRIKGGQDVYFLVNASCEAQTAEVSVRGSFGLMLWDPETGRRRPAVPSWENGGRTHFQVALAPAGSVFVLLEAPPRQRIVEANVTVEWQREREVRAYGAVAEGRIVLDDGSSRTVLAMRAGEPCAPLVLDGEWEFEVPGGNGLVLTRWLTRAEAPGEGEVEPAGPAADVAGWLPMVPGAWCYQLPAEPREAFPVPVWYRARFRADHLPPRLDLIIDGFAGREWRLYVNGQAVTAAPRRSSLDSQMKAVDIAPHLQRGENEIAIRLLVGSTTDGLLDPLKLIGDYALSMGEDGVPCLVAPRRTVRAAPWTEQGYPFCSGRGVYRRRFILPPEYGGQRVFLEAAAGDDVLEVRVNGEVAGVRLWPPHIVEITPLLRPGENLLELVVANTLVNLLEAVPRASGLAGPPRLVACREFTFALPA